MDFIIDCSKWICGQPHLQRSRDSQNRPTYLGKGGSFLYNACGYACFIGQISQQLGVDNASLNESGFPSNIRSSVAINKLVPIVLESTKLRVMVETSFAKKAMEINDNPNTLVATKIKKLRKLSKGHGHSLSFINIPK